jgi:hypothetical protein
MKHALPLLGLLLFLVGCAGNGNVLGVREVETGSTLASSSASSTAPFTRTLSLALMREGIAVSPGLLVVDTTLGHMGQTLVTDGGNLVVYAEPSSALGRLDATQLQLMEDSGGTLAEETLYIFLRPQTLVVYRGDDPDVLRVLRRLMGDPFALPSSS